MIVGPVDDTIVPCEAGRKKADILTWQRMVEKTMLVYQKAVRGR